MFYAISRFVYMYIVYELHCAILSINECYSMAYFIVVVAFHSRVELTSYYDCMSFVIVSSVNV